MKDYDSFMGNLVLETKFSPEATHDDRARIQNALVNLCGSAEGQALVETAVGRHGVGFRMVDELASSTTPSRRLSGYYSAHDNTSVLDRGLSDTDLLLTSGHELAHAVHEKNHRLPTRFYGLEARVVQLFAEGAVFTHEAELATRHYIQTGKGDAIEAHWALFAQDTRFAAKQKRIFDDLVDHPDDPHKLTEIRNRTANLYYHQIVAPGGFYYQHYVEDFMEKYADGLRAQFNTAALRAASLNKLPPEERQAMVDFYNEVAASPRLRSHHIIKLGEPLAVGRGGNFMTPDKKWLALQFDGKAMPPGILRGEALAFFNDYRAWRDDFVAVCENVAGLKPR